MVIADLAEPGDEDVFRKILEVYFPEQGGEQAAADDVQAAADDTRAADDAAAGQTGEEVVQ